MSRPVLLLVLLGILGGIAGWNFQRNVAAEKAELRPFAGYSDAELDALVAAYEQDVETYGRRWEQVTGRKVEVRQLAHSDERFQEFERVQGISRSTRALAGELAKRQVALEQLSQERAKRASERQVVLHFLKRCFIYRGSA